MNNGFDCAHRPHLSKPASCSNCVKECGTEVVIGGTPVVYWPVALDKDLLSAISSLFPNWFQDCNLNDLSKMSEAATNNGGSLDPPFIPLSPPMCEVDDSPLQGKSLNKNKESLKVKLMLRRPREDLVSRGVIPPMNTPAAFYEQRQRLDMAKKHDILKQKMQRRPLREELVRQHILEDSPGNIDPSLVEKQKQLKRARIADAINDHLCQRPGPLELVKANILHTTEDLEKAVKEGQLMFKSTSEGEPRKHPSLYLTYDDESSSEGGMSPEQCENGRASKDCMMLAHNSSLILDATSLLSATAARPAATLICPTPLSTTFITSSLNSSFTTTTSSALLGRCSTSSSPSLTSNTSSLSPLSSIASPQHTFLPSPQTPLTQTLLVAQTPLPHALTTPPLQNSAPGKDQSKNRKKCKGKMQPKARTIKFHEYKGPPSALKRELSMMPTETAYDILLQQQQLFLQCQLELKQKYTKIILPASLKSSNTDLTLSSVLALAATPSATLLSGSSAAPIPSSGNTPIAPAPPNHNSSSTPPAVLIRDQTLPSKLEDLKVSDLRFELKRRNLPVSGSKPQLIERLKFHIKTLGYTLGNNRSSLNNAAAAKDPGNSISSTSTQDLPKTAIIIKPLNDSSITIHDNPPVIGLIESSMEMGDDNILSPSLSKLLSVQPASVGPMDIDFDSAVDVGDLGQLMPLVDSGNINTPSPPPPPPPPPPRVVHHSVLGKSHLSRVPISKVNNQKTEAQVISNWHDGNVSSTPENQDGILHLKKKIEDLQRELINTQMQLQMQQNNVKTEDKDYGVKREVTDRFTQGSNDNSKNFDLIFVNRKNNRNLHSLKEETHTKTCALIEPSGHFISLQPLREQGCQILPYQQEHQKLVQMKGRSIADFEKRFSSFSSSSTNKNIQAGSILVPNGIVINSHHRTSSLPNFSGFILTGGNYSAEMADIINSNRNCHLPDKNHTPIISDKMNSENTIVSKEELGPAQGNLLNRLGIDGMKPPPNYSEATIGFRPSNQLMKASSVDIQKVTDLNQQVNDVIEILIKNGELPPSAKPEAPSDGQIGNVASLFVSMDKPQPPIPPPPPPPPPPHFGGQKGAQNPLPSMSSPSLFADLVMDGGSPGNLDLPLDLELPPVFDGMELGALESTVDPMVLQQQISGLIGCSGSVDDQLLADIKMEIGEDVDVASWLDSLTPTTVNSLSNCFTSSGWPTAQPNVISYGRKSPDSALSSGISSMRSSSSASSTASSSCGLNLNQCDPLLGSHSEHMDLLSMEDIDFKVSRAVSDLSWDQLDFSPT